MKNIFLNRLIHLLAFLCLSVSLASADESSKGIAKDVRCKVCGMFVAKYPAWITKISFKDKSAEHFDGVKDMMVYYFNPKKFGNNDFNDFDKIFIKDYYSLNWLEAKNAFFVIGSDVYGPMGHEFIPFSSKEAAFSFMKDHHGKKILTFDEITSSQVESMRVGNRMK